MKKWMGLLLAALLLMGLALAEEAKPLYEYEILPDGSAMILKYNGDEENVEIPVKFGRRTVTAIGEKAFISCKQLKSVIIPERVTSIGDLAFAYCTALERITIPDGVTTLGVNPFESCDVLTDIVVSIDHPTLATIDGVLFEKPTKTLVCYPYAFKATHYTVPEGIRHIGANAFHGSDLQGVTLPSTLETIGAEAFGLCFDLVDIQFPAGLKAIGACAFESCYKIIALTLPEGLETIGSCAFEGCKGLTAITIPDSVTTIKGNPFVYCWGLTEIRVSPDHPTLATIDGVLFEKTNKVLVCYPCAFTAEAYAVPEGIASIGPWAFSGNNVLRRVTLPATLTGIGDFGFNKCTALETAELPPALATIGRNAFYDCSFLTGVTLPDSLQVLGECAFLACTSLTKANVPGGVKSIGASAFEYCRGVTELVIAEGVEEIGTHAFYGCNKLEKVTIPGSVTGIGADAFTNFYGQLSFVVARDSAARQYAIDNGIPFTYVDALDWLTN